VEQDRRVAAVDRPTLSKLLETWGGFLDAGLPSLVFVCVYTFAGRRLGPALAVAVAMALMLTVIRLVRHDRLGSVVAGLFGMVLSAIIAYRSGQARNVYLLGLVSNAAFLLLYVISAAVRWPVLGVLVGLIRQDVRGWRTDADLLRGFTRATLLWASMFVVRLSVQVPLYLTDHVGALGTLRVILGWPLTLLVLVGTFVLLRQSVGEEKWVTLRDDLIATYTGDGASRTRLHQAARAEESEAEAEPPRTQTP
jgi:Protein of unknown function (DUF3159)